MNYWFKNRYSPHTVLNIKIKKTLFKGVSDYQKIEILESHDFGRMLVLDGIINLTENDEFIYHEMMVHVPLFSHLNPKNVLVIGGGDGGIVRELSKHPQIERIDLVEIDSMVVEKCKRFLPGVSVGFKEPRLTVYYDDGIQFVKNKENFYDVIIVDSPDPIGAGKRLFQKIFYNYCLRSLKEDGLLTAQSETPTFKQEFQIMKSMQKKLHSIFPIVKIFTAYVPSYAPGIWCFVLCSKKYDPLNNFQEKRYKRLNLKNRYYNADIHLASLALPNFIRKEFHNLQSSQ